VNGCGQVQSSIVKCENFVGLADLGVQKGRKWREGRVVQFRLIDIREAQEYMKLGYDFVSSVEGSKFARTSIFIKALLTSPFSHMDSKHCMYVYKWRQWRRSWQCCAGRAKWKKPRVK
jgi:hypothetical protein